MSEFNPEEEVLTIDEIDEILRSDAVGLTDGSIDMKIGRVLLCAVWAGENQDQLAIMTGMPLAEVNMIASVLKKNGVFGNRLNFRREYLESDGSGVALNCDIACGMNQLVTGDKNGERWWKMTEDGIEHVRAELLPKPEVQKMMDHLDVTSGKPAGEWRKDWKKAEDKKRKKARGD